MNANRQLRTTIWTATLALACMFSTAAHGQSGTAQEQADLITYLKARPHAETVDPNRSGKAESTSVDRLKIRNGSGKDRAGASEPKESTVTSRTNLLDKTSEPLDQAKPPDEGWKFEVTPYLYATGLRGPVGARGRTLEVDASFGKVLDNLDLELAGTFEARKNRFVSLNDFMWVKLSNTRETPGGLYGTAKIGINLAIIDPEAGYRVVDSKSGSIDVLGGVRVWSVETNLNTTSGRLEGFDVSQRKTWAAPVVGVRGRADLTSRWFLEGKFDIGGGVGADLTTQVYAGGGYRFSPHVGLIGGYRYLKVDYDDNKGFLFNTSMNGIVIGVRFSF